MGELQKLEAKRDSNRNVMTQTNKDLSHVKKVAVKTEEQLHRKGELLEQVITCVKLCIWFIASFSGHIPGQKVRQGVGC